MNPDISILQKHATPSSFSRGAETVLDPTYRNRTELKADELTFSLQQDKESQYKLFVSRVEDELQTSMFIGRNIFLKLHKLTIYSEGSYFDWHRNLTYGNAYYEMVLITLNIEWEGGELMLRHQDIDTIVNMYPTKQSRKSSKALQPVVVIFYTDTEYKVMSMTKGTHLVLQFDVEVVEQLP